MYAVLRTRRLRMLKTEYCQTPSWRGLCPRKTIVTFCGPRRFGRWDKADEPCEAFQSCCSCGSAVVTCKSRPATKLKWKIFSRYGNAGTTIATLSIRRAVLMSRVDKSASACVVGHCGSFIPPYFPCAQ